MKMRNLKVVRFFALFVFLFASLLAAGNFNSASANTEQAITGKVKKFYGWYVNEIHNDRLPFRNQAMIRNHSSRRLWKWLNSQAYRDFGADYFLDAQDFARDWGTQIAISNFKMKGNVTTFTMRMGSPKPDQTQMGPHTIKLKLVKESGSWKIDRVDGN